MSEDGLTWTLKLREGVTFSDGAPFSSADVLFSFAALYDDRVKSEIASSLLVKGQPLQVRALDASTVVVRFPAPYGPGLSLLDALPILPRHKLKPALDAGTFRDAWSVSTPPGDIVGLGPFVIKEYVTQQRLVFARNERFWLQDTDGRPLPRLDTIELQFVPDQNTEVVRVKGGVADLMGPLRFEDVSAFRDLERRGTMALHDAGVSIAPDMLWVNLTPAATSTADRPWLRRDELRQAISLAVDRTALINTVFLGEAVPIAGPITPGHHEWFSADVARPRFDVAAAKQLLASIGLADRTGDGMLDDERGRTARFSVLTQKGHSARERSSVVLQEQLRAIGLQVDVVPMEQRTMIERWSKGEYDAIYFAIEFDSFDPGRNLEFWMSSGAFHFWNPGQQKPATTWERRIDELMLAQSTTLDPAARRQLFADAQRVLAEHQPAVYFAAPRILLAASSRVKGIQPSVLAPHILWNAEQLSVSGPPAPVR